MNTLLITTKSSDDKKVLKSIKIRPCTGIKYSMLFQNKLSSKSGSRILVNFGRSIHLPLAVVAAYHLHCMFCNRISGHGTLGNAFIIELTLVRFSFLSFTNVGHLLRNCGTFVEFGFSLYCLCISYISVDIACISIDYCQLLYQQKYPVSEGYLLGLARILFCV